MTDPNLIFRYCRKYWQKKGVRDKIESVIGEGVEVLKSLLDEQKYFDQKVWTQKMILGN